MIDKSQTITKYCDIQTNDDKWRLGIIDNSKANIFKEKDIYEVFLDGWSSNKKQKICIHSEKIQPPRSYSKGYTGQKSYPLRNYEFNISQINHIENWLKLFYKFDFYNFPVLEISILFRCELFILVDTIIFHDWNKFNSKTIIDDFKRITGFFNNIIQISILFFEKLPGFITKATISKFSYNKNSYLDNLSICYIELIYELIIILKVICGLDSRTVFFFEKHEEYIQPFLENLIDLGIVNYLLRVIKDLNLVNFIFLEKIHLLLVFFEFVFRIFLKISHSKVKNLTKFIIELKDIFSQNNTLINYIKNNREDSDVSNFYENLKLVALKNPNLQRDINIELFLVQLEIIEEDKSCYRLLHTFENPRSRSSRCDVIPPNFKKESFKMTKTSFDIIRDEKSSFQIISTDYKNSDYIDEYAILSYIENSIRDTDKIKRIILWRKKILEIAKSNGILIAKIISQKTLKNLEITDFDIIEANLTFMENYNTIDKSIKIQPEDYQHIIEKYEKELIRSIEN